MILCIGRYSLGLIYCPTGLEAPPQSPHLDLIELLLTRLEREIRKYNIRNEKDFRVKLISEWNEIGQETIIEFVKSMAQRLKCVFNQKGLLTKY